tara:strand:- start:1033 stop:1941 length:909 start_codon:yes stop_codon:yes gene_type:complete
MSGTIFHPFVLDNAAGQETVVGIGSDQEKYGVGISSDTHITGIQTVTGFLHAGGGIKDTSGDMGDSGQVLSSTGSGLNWINPGDANVASASNVGTNDASSTNATHYLAFVSSTSGNNPVRIDTALNYNPSTDTLTAGNFVGDISGTTGGFLTGMIMMWGGTTAPTGWQLCDGGTASTSTLQTLLGQNNVPDLRDKFVVGAGSAYARHATGGESTVQLQTTHLPSHFHLGFVNATGSQQRTGSNLSANNFAAKGTGAGNIYETYNITTAGDGSGYAGKSSPVGDGTSHENKPPYYALTYIIKT